MKKIIFVCTGNTCRSPMAMAVCNDKFLEKGLDNWIADSAGIACTGGRISDNSVKALEKIGINLSDYQSKQLDFDMINQAELLVCMTKAHQQVLIDSGICDEKVRVLCGGVPDPYGGDLPVYENCLKNIICGVNALFEEGVFVDI